jgi:hypothetical protein
VVDFLRALFSDDIFPVQTVSVVIPSLRHRFAGGRTISPEHVVRFKEHSGTYELTYDWRLLP